MHRGGEHSQNSAFLLASYGSTKLLIFALVFFFGYLDAIRDLASLAQW